MDFSLFFFADSGSADAYRLLIESARFADANGFSAVWTPERHFHGFGGLYPNPAVTGAAVAMVTERVQIRAGSVVAALHHPARIAEEWSMVDNLSRGRVSVSFASGWHPVNFVLRPENFKDRRVAMADTIDAVRRLWRGEAVEFEDGTGGRTPVRTLPMPVQDELPIWITSAGSEDTFVLAGRMGCGVLTHLLGQDVETLTRNIAVYRKTLAESHGDGTPGRVALMLHTMIGTDRDAVKELVRGPMSAYLRSSIDLIVRSSPGLLPAGVDPGGLRERDKAFIVDTAFERYFTGAGLFGTLADGADTVAGLRSIGVDEVACLIDYGVPHDRVLESLPLLAELNSRCSRAAR